MTKKSKPKKYWYVQEWGTYTPQTPVFVGYSIPEITTILNKMKIKQEIKDLWNQDHENTAQVFKTVSGGVWRNSGYTLLFIPKFEDTWDTYEMILHEVFHLVIYQLGQQKLFLNKSTYTIEEEGLAYQIEYLFREIRRKLQNHFI